MAHKYGVCVRQTKHALTAVKRYCTSVYITRVAYGLDEAHVQNVRHAVCLRLCCAGPAGCLNSSSSSAPLWQSAKQLIK